MGNPEPSPKVYMTMDAVQRVDGGRSSTYYR